MRFQLGPGLQPAWARRLEAMAQGLYTPYRLRGSDLPLRGASWAAAITIDATMGPRGPPGHHCADVREARAFLVVIRPSVDGPPPPA
jgi:hypothetical protein